MDIMNLPEHGFWTFWIRDTSQPGIYVEAVAMVTVDSSEIKIQANSHDEYCLNIEVE